MTQDDDSGNRWEPEARPASPTEPPAAGPRGIRDRARALRGNRTAVAGGAVAAVLAVGAAGFGVGWAASPDDEGPGRDGPDGHHGFPEDVHGDGDGDGQFSPGQQTAPDPESFSQSSWYVSGAGPRPPRSRAASRGSRGRPGSPSPRGWA